MEKLKIHIGQRIKKYVKDNRVSQASWSRKQGVKQQSVWRYMKRETMRIDTLFSICQTLQYNFLREIADQLPAGFPPQTTNPLQEENAALKKEIELLKHEVEILNRVVGMRKQE